MNLVYGEIAKVLPEAFQVGKVRVRKAEKNVSMDLLINPASREKVLLCGGLLLSKVDPLLETE